MGKAGEAKAVRAGGVGQCQGGGTAEAVAMDGLALLPGVRAGAQASGKPAGQGHHPDSQQKLGWPLPPTYFLSHYWVNTSFGATGASKASSNLFHFNILPSVLPLIPQGGQGPRPALSPYQDGIPWRHGGHKTTLIWGTQHQV